LRRRPCFEAQPALENFYNLLTDEQKARFNLLGSQQS
jgi:hypothetical protein